ncbi:unnamed protein product [Adineta steineri]|uniref:Uncharacterized protein n=1 Tax=Adineta steineri TaxID=433720 RepID=A0A815JT17_9BILA|nr:unnamed protein product [Adineta steineri]CAF3969599.1 unnamed protein product [Adineta steineri]
MYSHLSDDEKLIPLKYKKLKLLRAIKISGQDCMLRIDDLASILFKPCQHTGFCEECTAKLNICLTWLFACKGESTIISVT